MRPAAAEALEPRRLLAADPAAGTIDATFANGGNAMLGFTAEAVAVQSDGKVLAAGLMSGSPAGGTEAVLERLNADGTPDTSFGAAGSGAGGSGAGTVSDAAEAGEGFYGVTVQPDGKVIASGTSNGKFLLVRYNPDGTLDPTFGTGGRVTTALSGTGGTVSGTAYSVALEPGSDGGIDVGGNAGGHFAAAGYTAAGAPDTGFNNGTPAQLTAAPAAASGATGDVLGQIIVQSDGKVVGVGATGNNVFVTRLNGDGSLDPTFDAAGSVPGVLVVGGLAAPALGSRQDVTEGLAIDAQGNLLVANRTPGGDFGLVRVRPDGTPDAAFGNASGTAGLVSTDLGGDDDADVVTVQGDGRILVAGTTTAGGVTQTAVVAYKADGTLDTTFANGGKDLYDPGLPAPATAAVQPAPAASAAARPDAEGIGAIVTRVFGTQQPDGRLLLGQSQFTGTRTVSSLRRLNVSPSPALPSGTLAATVKANVPTSVVAGAKTGAKVAVTVTAPAGRAVSGPVAVAVYFSPSQSLAGATQVATLTRKLKLKAGRRATLQVKLSAFPQVPAGNYFLLAGVTAPDASVTGAAAAGQVTVGPPSVRLAASDLRPPASAKPGKAATVTVTLQNTGNVAAEGTASLALTATAATAAGAPLALATVPVRLRLQPNGTRTFRARFRVPAALPAGSYTLAASLDVTPLGSDATTAGAATAASPLVVS